MLFLLSFLVLALASAQSVLPAWPKSYHITATMSLPYASIQEAIEVWFDGVNGRQRVEYYSGMDIYIFRADINATWQVNPVISQQECFATLGETDLQSFFPDTTGFTLLPGQVVVNGVSCNNWQLLQTVGDKQNTYNIYINPATGFPVRYRMMGYDSLLGSHYDEYLLDYNTIQVVSFSTSDAHFQEPAMGCGDFPGPGVQRMNPLLTVSDHFPSASSSSSSSSSTLFGKFMTEYNKKYASKQEQRKREIIFTGNQQYIDALNHKNAVLGKSLRLRMNGLGDLTEEEMSARRGVVGRKKLLKAQKKLGAVADSSIVPPSFIHKAADKVGLPNAVDWRSTQAVGPVADQGVCGSCWSFGTVGALEGQYSLTFSGGKVFTKLSEQELVDCSWSQGNNACDGGEDFRAYSWMIQNNNGGIAATANYGPYLMADGWCNANKTANTLSINGWVAVQSGSEPALMSALASVGPISISIDASHKSLSFYASGVYYEPECGNGEDDLDHTVLAAGYGTVNGEDYWIVRNSWSTYWGDEGYVYMSRQNNNCGVATAPTYPVVDKTKSKH